jgi:DNA-directed RNA polymerase subunit K/omega
MVSVSIIRSFISGVRLVTQRTFDVGKFEVVRLAALRTAQLMRGCSPRVRVGHKLTTTALREIADGKVFGGPRLPAKGRLAAA